MFSVCTVLYGPHEDLAEKLLSSWKNYDKVTDFRIGLNAVSEKSRYLLQDWASRQKVPVYVFEPEGQENVGKYPLMRAMFRSCEPAEYLMWFDDDSYLDEYAGTEWWRSVGVQAASATQVGAVHRIIQRSRQFEVIQQQPWYSGKSLGPRHRYTFATGGWWTLNRDFALAHDYPFTAIHHNGGDSVLGELIRQQGGKLKNAGRLCQCHCESCIKKVKPTAGCKVHINVGGRQGRRGIGVTGERYVWADGNPESSTKHQNFRINLTTYNT